MPTAKYISFQIKNTGDLPMEVSLNDPDGNRFKVTLNTAEESMQVAPMGTTWTIKFVPNAAQDNVKSPSGGKKDERGKGESNPRPSVGKKDEGGKGESNPRP